MKLWQQIRHIRRALGQMSHWTLRKRLRGIRLPWGTFITGAYADDAHIGIALSDGRVLIITLNEYCRASNSRINFAKSKYMPLSTKVHSLPQWASDLGLQFHDPQTPFGCWATTWSSHLKGFRRTGTLCTTLWSPFPRTFCLAA